MKPLPRRREPLVSEQQGQREGGPQPCYGKRYVGGAFPGAKMTIASCFGGIAATTWFGGGVSWQWIPMGELREGDPVLDENGHDWQKPPLRERMVGSYLEVCVHCGMERVGPRTKETCPGGSSSAPYVPRHRADR